MVRLRFALVLPAFLFVWPAQADNLLVRVATWNIEKVGDPFYDGDPGDEDALEEQQYLAAVEVLARIDADVVAINEVSSDTDVSGLYSLAFDLGYPYVVVPSNADNLGPTGEPRVVGFTSDRNAILSRFPIVTQHYFDAAELSADAAARDTTRLVVAARVDVPASSRDLVVFSQHFKSGEDASDRFRRAIEGHRVGQAVDEFDTGGAAVIVAGDFNQELGDPPQVPPYAEPPGLDYPFSFQLGADIQTLMGGPGLEPDVFAGTVPPLVPLLAAQLDGSLATRLASGRRIDYLLADGVALELGNAATEIYNSLLDVPGAPGLAKAGAPLANAASTEAADHLVVFADLVFPLDMPCSQDAECEDGNPCTVGQCLTGLCAQFNVPSGQVPDFDTCGNDLDDDCDGQVDELCFCEARMDIDGTEPNGEIEITDVQCMILLALWDLAGRVGAPPGCAAEPIERTDLDCSATWSVVDVQLTVALALGLPFDPALDRNANGCIDSCDINSAVICGDDELDPGEECDEGDNDGVTSSSCRMDCTVPVCGDGVIDSGVVAGAHAGEECDDGNADSGDGCTAQCTLELDPVFGGGLVVTEIFSNPAPPVDDELGEWIEVHNLTGAALDLRGLELRDDGIDSHVIAESVFVPPLGYVVLGRSQDESINGGVTVHYAYTAFFLSNGADEVELRFGDRLLDRVAYDGGATFPDVAGASMSLDPSAWTAQANDSGAVWCVADEPSPGAANPPCAAVCGNGVLEPGEGCDDGNLQAGDGCSSLCVAELFEAGPGDLVISEIMQNPAAVFDASGEWFEVYNAADHTIDLLGVRIEDNAASHVVAASVVVAPGEYAVLGVEPDPLLNGGVTLDYSYTGLQLGNGSDRIELYVGAELIDGVAYDGGPLFPDPNGASMSLDTAALTASLNDDGAHWCPGVTPYGAGDLGTPGSPNPACP